MRFMRGKNVDTIQTIISIQNFTTQNVMKNQITHVPSTRLQCWKTDFYTRNEFTKKKSNLLYCMAVVRHGGTTHYTSRPPDDRRRRGGIGRPVDSSYKGLGPHYAFGRPPKNATGLTAVGWKTDNVYSLTKIKKRGNVLKILNFTSTS